MAEEKFLSDANALPAPEHRDPENVDPAKEKWMTRLEKNIQATEESEKAYTKKEQQMLAGIPAIAAAYEKVQADAERQKLQDSHAESYQKLRHTLPEGRAKFLQVGLSVASQVQNYEAHIQALEKETKEYQEEMRGLKKKQRKLIEESLALFARHENQIKGLLQQLEGIPSIKQENRQLWQNLFDDANTQAKRLKKENTKKSLNFGLCNQYVIDAGKTYQNCYGSIIHLIEPQAKQVESGGVHVRGGSIGADGANVQAGGNVQVGHNTTINHIYQAAEKEIREMAKMERDFDEIKAQYDALQRNYQEKEEELAFNKAALKHQQEGFSQREQEFFEQTAKAQAAKTAAEKQAAEQAEKIGIAKQEAEQSKKQMETMQQRMAQIEAETAAKTEQIEKPRKAKEQRKQALLKRVLRDNQYDEDHVLMFSLIKTKSRKPFVRRAAMHTLTTLAGNPHCTEPHFVQLFTAASTALQDENCCVRAAALQTLAALAGNLHCTEQYFTQLLTAVTTLQDKDSDVQQTAWKIVATFAGNPHCTEQHLAQLITATTETIALQDAWYIRNTLKTLATLTGNMYEYSEDSNSRIAVRTAALKTLTALADNPHCTEQHFAQLITVVTAAQKDEHLNVRAAALQIFPTLAGSKHCTGQPFTQLLTAVTTAQHDQGSDVRQAVLQTLTTLAGNPRCIEQHFEQLLATIITALKGGDWYVWKAVPQTLTTLAENPHLSAQQATQIHSAIVFGLKGISAEWEIKNRLIQSIKECSPNQLPRYTALANKLMQDANPYVQLTAISLLDTIKSRCQNLLEEPHSVALEIKEEPEDQKEEEVLLNNQVALGQNTPALEEEQARAFAHSTPATAAAAVGFLPQPKEQKEQEEAAHPAAAVPAVLPRR